MYIQKLKIENFKSIYEPLELDFNNIKGLWKISGAVGAGKTTIGEAILFGLFGTVGGKNNGDLISWGRKHGLVEIWCTSNGRNIYIKREMNIYGQSPIYAEIDGEELVFTNKRDAQQQLENEYYDTSRVTLELLCIISFNNFKSLATLNASDTKRFLDQVLGFYTLTQYADKCKELKSNNLQYIYDIQNDINKLKSQITKLEELSNVQVIEGDIEETNKQYKLITEDIYNARKEFVDKTKKIQEQISKYNQELASIVSLGKNKAKEIAFIEKGKCPTCGAPIDQSQLEVKRKEKQELTNQYNNIKQLIEVQNEKIRAYEVKHKLEEGPKTAKSNELYTLLIQLKEQSKHISININEIENLNKSIQEKENQLIEYQQEDAEWELLYNTLSVDVRAKILESFIPALNKNILKYAQRLHQPYLIQFDANFKCNISIYGFDQDISIASLSTGQLKTVDMIIILGVLGTIIGSSSVNIIFLDELFSNLDNTLRNEMCGVLREFIKPDDTMFIISHQDLDEHYFDGRINMKLELRNQFEKHSVAEIEEINKESH